MWYSLTKYIENQKFKNILALMRTYFEIVFLQTGTGPRDRRVQLFLEPDPDPIDWTFLDPYPDFLFFPNFIYSFQILFILSKFFSNLKLSVGLKIQAAFIRLLTWKLAHFVYFSGNFEGDFIKIKSYLALIRRRTSSGSKKFGPGPGRLNFFGPRPDDL
jgi:hypothetical protein